MKKRILFLGGILMFGVAMYAGYFYYTQLRGIEPAIFGSPEDIADIIKNQNSKNLEVNNTQFSLKLPQEFEISVFADELPGVRDMAFDEEGNLLVSQPSQGTLTYLEIKEGNVARQITPIKDLNNPHGLATGYCTTMCVEQIPGESEGGCNDTCELYVAEEHEVVRFFYDPLNLKNISNTREKIVDLPTGGRHTTRSLLLRSDRTLLVSIGSSCDVCYEEDNRRASIIAVDTDEENVGAWQSYATGLRNSVFMALNPKTNEVWTTEMGRDFLGDNLPPDEINIIKNRELNSNVLPRDYGWPLCYGKNVFDSGFDERDYGIDPCNENNNRWGSHIDLPAHVAPLGLAFIPDTWPEEMRGDLLVAYHGSWNRSVPTGYKVVRVKLDEQGNYEGIEDFITGWLTSDNRALGRPAGLAFDGGGNLYISDDKAGVVYKVTYDRTMELTNKTPLLELVDSEVAGSDITRVYHLDNNYENGPVTLVSSRILELSPNKRFIALEADEGYGISFLDVEKLQDYENRVQLEDVGEDGQYPDVGPFMWSPNSRHVAFTTAHSMGKSRLYIYHVDSGEYDAIDVSSFGDCASFCYAENPTWSADGAHIALVEYDYGVDWSKVNYRIGVFDSSAKRIRSLAIDTEVGEKDIKIVWDAHGEPSYYISD